MSAEQGDVAMVRSALDLSDLRLRTDPIFYTSALAALDRLAAERDDWMMARNEQKARAEKAERQRDIAYDQKRDLYDRAEAAEQRVEELTEAVDLAVAINNDRVEELVAAEQRARELEAVLPSEEHLDLAWKTLKQLGFIPASASMLHLKNARAALRPSEDTSDE